MENHRRTFSICIPAYNRAKYLSALLDSIFVQDYQDFEIVICEDKSREREQINQIVKRYDAEHPDTIRYFENEVNLGYDANIRELVSRASGEYCFFLGNDDILCQGALSSVADIVGRHENVGMVLKTYAWFDETPEELNQVVRYFSEERVFAPGKDAITVCYRRSGVISGYVIHRDAAHANATDKFDGTLYYQMHITASVLAEKAAVSNPHLLVLCRDSEHEFGNSTTEKDVYAPGPHKAQARLNMVRGAVAIIKDLKETKGLDVVDPVVEDYANYFYICIRDQLKLPLRDYWKLYRGFGQMGFDKYPMFHVYIVVAYILGANRFDTMAKWVRLTLGRSPQFGGFAK